MEERNRAEKLMANESTCNKAQSKKYTNRNNDEFYEKDCKVLKYDPKNKTLDFMFDKYGIRINGIEEFGGDTVTIKYRGEVGKPNFIVKV